jgi:hypothetical protein
LERLEHQQRGSDDDEIYLAILETKFARDLALNRRDISNIAMDVARGTFHRHKDGAASVKMLVRPCHHLLLLQ